MLDLIADRLLTLSVLTGLIASGELQGLALASGLVLVARDLIVASFGEAAPGLNIKVSALERVKIGFQFLAFGLLIAPPLWSASGPQAQHALGADALMASRLADLRHSRRLRSANPDPAKVLPGAVIAGERRQAEEMPTAAFCITISSPIPCRARVNSCSNSPRVKPRFSPVAWISTMSAGAGQHEIGVGLGLAVFLIVQVQHGWFSNTPQEMAATWSRIGSVLMTPSSRRYRVARRRATQAPVIEAVRVPPSAWITSQSMEICRSPRAFMSVTARNERPIRR